MDSSSLSRPICERTIETSVQNDRNGFLVRSTANPDLLPLTRTLRRALHRMGGLSRLTLPVPLGALTGLLRVAMRRFLLMRRVRMILGLEVLGLVWGTFAIPGHEFSKFEAVSELSIDVHCPWRPRIHRKLGVP